MLSNTLRLNFSYLIIIQIFDPRYHAKIIRYILKNEQKGQCVFIHMITRLIVMKMKMKMKNRSHRYDIYRPRRIRGHKYTKYKKCLSIMMVICIKQQLSK